MMKKEKDIKIRYFLCPVSRLGTISGYYAEGKFKSYIDEWIGVPTGYFCAINFREMSYTCLCLT